MEFPWMLRPLQCWHHILFEACFPENVLWQSVSLWVFLSQVLHKRKATVVQAVYVESFFLGMILHELSTYFCASLINVFWSRVQTVLGFCRWEGALFSAECGKWESPNLFVGELVGCFPTKIYWFHCCASREMKESHKHVHYFLSQFFWKHYSGCLVSFLLFSYFVLMPHSRAVTKDGDKRSFLQRNVGKYGGHLFWCIWISHTVWSFFHWEFASLKRHVLSRAAKTELKRKPWAALVAKAQRVLLMMVSDSCNSTIQ